MLFKALLHRHEVSNMSFYIAILSHLHRNDVLEGLTERYVGRKAKVILQNLPNPCQIILIFDGGEKPSLDRGYEYPACP